MIFLTLLRTLFLFEELDLRVIALVAVYVCCCHLTIDLYWLTVSINDDSLSLQLLVLCFDRLNRADSSWKEATRPENKVRLMSVPTCLVARCNVVTLVFLFH